MNNFDEIVKDLIKDFEKKYGCVLKEINVVQNLDGVWSIEVKPEYIKEARRLKLLKLNKLND